MDYESILNALKVDLGLTASVYNERLTMAIKASIEAIEEEGIKLNFDSAKDQNLILMYSRWLWNKRESGEGMPRMIRYALNNRLFSQKVGEADA